MNDFYYSAYINVSYPFSNDYGENNAGYLKFLPELFVPPNVWSQTLEPSQWVNLETGFYSFGFNQNQDLKYFSCIPAFYNDLNYIADNQGSYILNFRYRMRFEVYSFNSKPIPNFNDIIVTGNPNDDLRNLQTYSITLSSEMPFYNGPKISCGVFRLAECEFLIYEPLNWRIPANNMNSRNRGFKLFTNWIFEVC